jgi:hypothetical protein
VEIVVQVAHVLPDVPFADQTLHLVLLAVSETGQEQHDGKGSQDAVVDMRDPATPTPIGALAVHQPA